MNNQTIMISKIKQFLTILNILGLSVFIVHLFIWVEVFSYKGFLLKHFHIGSGPLMLIGIISIASILVIKIFIRKDIINNQFFVNLLFKLNKTFLGIGMAMYIFLNFYENSNYPNIVFTKFHVNLNNLITAIIFNSVVVVGNIAYSNIKLMRNKINIAKKDKKYGYKNLLGSFLLTTSVIFFSWYSLKNIANTLIIVLSNIKNTTFTIKATYDEKMSAVWGNEYYFWKYIVDHTPPDATIYVPPQEFPWGTIGNAGLVRYFLYPRRVVNMNWNQVTVPKNSYIVVAWGDWAIGAEKYGWPKVNIPAKGTWYFTSDNKAEYVEGDYLPIWSNEDRKWGIVEPIYANH